MRNFLAILLFFQVSINVVGQDNKVIKGVVVDQNNVPVPDVSIIVKPSIKGAFTDIDGKFKIEKLRGIQYTLTFSAISFKTRSIIVDLTKQNEIHKKIVLFDNVERIDEVIVKGKKKATKLKEKGFSVTAIETQALKAQNLEINNILDKTAGVRVRRTGGLGSDFEYALDGMSGNAIRFFVDGIPMDFYGTSYSINNLPISLIERIDIYKGVVPTDLGSDALGGAINLVTKKQKTNFAEVSYSFGSFNTHQTAIHGQWIQENGLTTRLSAFYNFSDNNYEVWGKGVHYADESTGFKAVEFTEENPAERFNDDFQTTTAKFDIGLTDKKWADQVFVSLLASDLKKGVQTAQTMARVFGRVRNNEQTIAPTLTYKKKDLFAKGLDVNAFAGYSYTKGVLIDTTLVQYDWRGEIIGTRLAGGEMGYDGKSQFTQKNHYQLYRANATYELPNDFKIGVNYLQTNSTRSGEDPFLPVYRIPYIEPQSLGTQFAGLSLETEKFEDKLRANVFLKYYGYNATVNDLEFTDQYEVVEYTNSISNFGGGFAVSYKLIPNLLLKSSLEQATRFPSPTEALGDGITIDNNPFIKPEQSFNFNFGAVLGNYEIGNHKVKAEVNTFYRNVSDRLLFTVIDGQGNGQFRNINKVSGIGAELDIMYEFDEKLRLSLNGSYYDYRNNLEFEENGNRNIVYRDRLRNLPYLLANAGLQYNTDDLIQKNSKSFFYVQSSYVHEFFLSWPSLASEENKSVIPSQLIFDAGLSYTFPSKKVIIAFDMSNILNEQVYDNYLLQKPGRAFSVKLNYQLSQ
ncbi:Outer membrane receptor proteins, mostly Fe transport [Tenacibaculum sp. MAR_2009_124]|uniref:TonB-dependent receptor n=1 Tax=Tenacibaculum sp. MAR_2009_124 TaxID=1250059 RepID=UPI000894DD94|nr:TonB-dependent receptor [Tenacibaculum sp. MAR_2009_124]SEC23912.1 Outer membrane receptor proteins, mostly Fe transport [Tenacibaculum sp. MAR_2009_124]